MFFTFLRAALRPFHTPVTRSYTALRRRPRPPMASSISLHDGQIPEDFRVDRIDDPDGTTRIVRVVGAVTYPRLPAISHSWSDVLSPHLVHIDLADAAIADHRTMIAFEQAIDHLERQRIGIRIVGLDPLHPALAS